MVRRLTSILDKKASIPVISVLSAKMWLSKDGIHSLTKPWFCKCGISKEAAASAIADDDNHFAGFEEGDEDAVKTSETDL